MRTRATRRSGYLCGGLAGVALGAVLFAPAAAAADSLQVILKNAVLQDTAVVLSDAALSGIRGRGAEGLHLSAGGANDIAVILWDEQNRRRPQGQQGSGLSRSVGFGNVQANSLVTRRD